MLSRFFDTSSRRLLLLFDFPGWHEFRLAAEEAYEVVPANRAAMRLAANMEQCLLPTGRVVVFLFPVGQIGAKAAGALGIEAYGNQDSILEPVLAIAASDLAVTHDRQQNLPNRFAMGKPEVLRSATWAG